MEHVADHLHFAPVKGNAGVDLDGRRQLIYFVTAGQRDFDDVGLQGGVGKLNGILPFLLFLRFKNVVALLAQDSRTHQEQISRYLGVILGYKAVFHHRVIIEFVQVVHLGVLQSNPPKEGPEKILHSFLAVDLGHIQQP